MSKFDLAISQCFGRWSQDLWLWYYFKFVLPRIETTTLDGIQLDLASFSPRVRNRILMGYEDPEKRLCREHLTKDDSVLELGAAIGFIGLFCQKRLGIRNYISVEANPQTIEILKRNYALNHLTPTVWNLALGRDCGMVNFHIDGDFWEHSIAGLSGEHRRTVITIPSLTLDALIKKAGRVTALIIDVEGAERAIDFRQVSKDVSKIIIELHPQLIGKTAVANIFNTLGEMGFSECEQQENTFAFIRHK